MKVPAILQIIAQDLLSQDAQAIVVGGAVRDHFLSLPVKDYDIEVFGLGSLKALGSTLSKYGSVNLVGKHFGVLKLTHGGEVYDFSLPRRESKSGGRHQDFDVTVDGEMCFEEAASRRDFSCNAMGFVLGTKVWLDPFGGKKDMEAGILRHVHSHTFVEDPLRVYRAVQFAARFGWDIAEETMQLCRRMVSEGMLDALPKERVYLEWQKLLLKAPKPSQGFGLMRELEIIADYFPELHALIGTPQSPRWHPEGDVWTHTMMALDKMAQHCRRAQQQSLDEKQTLKMLLATLCHDLGKASTTTIEADGRIRSIGHEKAGLIPTRSLLYRLTDEHDFVASLLPLVEHHLKPSQFYAQGAKSAAIRRLATRVNIEELVLVAKADFLGRTTPEAASGTYPAGAWLLSQAKALQVNTSPPPPLLRGRDLIGLGLSPSPRFREILDAVYEQQIEGKCQNQEEALAYVRKYIAAS